jgi:hypothetical protein
MRALGAPPSRRGTKCQLTRLGFGGRLACLAWRAVAGAGCGAVMGKHSFSCPQRLRVLCGGKRLDREPMESRGNSIRGVTSTSSVTSVSKLEKREGKERFAPRARRSMRKFFSGMQADKPGTRKGGARRFVERARWYKNAGWPRGASVLARNGVAGSQRRPKSPLGRFRQVHGTSMNTGWNRGLRAKKRKFERLFVEKRSEEVVENKGRSQNGLENEAKTPTNRQVVRGARPLEGPAEILAPETARGRLCRGGTAEWRSLFPRRTPLPQSRQMW